MLNDPDHAALGLRYTTINSAVADYLMGATGFQLANMRIPSTTPGLGEVLRQRKALFWDDIGVGLDPSLANSVTRLCGITPCILLPLIDQLGPTGHDGLGNPYLAGVSNNERDIRAEHTLYVPNRDHLRPLQRKRFHQSRCRQWSGAD